MGSCLSLRNAWLLQRWGCWWVLLLLPPAPLAGPLRRVVVLSRHSVKNPYPPPGAPLERGVADSPLSAYSGRPWPAFSAAPGELTARGKELMRLMGSYYRERYVELLQDPPCQRVAFFADPASSRDLDSAEAFAQGLTGPSGCAAAVNQRSTRQHLQRLFRDQPDAWDVAAARGCSPPSAEEVAALLGVEESVAASGAVRAMPSAWLRVYRQQLGRVQDVTQCCSQEACAGGAGTSSAGGLCTIFGLPLRVAPNVTWRAVGGALGTASALAEIFTMQMCEGLEAGWGLREEDIVELLSLLEVPFYRGGANEATSRALGSDLLDELLVALGGGGEAPAISLYFGHDTNIQFLRQMLRLEWLSEGWWPNGAEPGAQLVFEIYEEDPAPDGAPSYAVKLLKVVATPRQQRERLPLTRAAPPSVVPVWVPGCGGLLCPLTRFLALGRAALRAECVQAPALNRTALSLGGDTAAMLAGKSVAMEPVQQAAPALAAVGSSPPSAGGAGQQKDLLLASAQGSQPPLPQQPAALPSTPEAGIAARPDADASGGGPSSGTIFMVIFLVAGYLGWTYLQKKRAEGRGYETLGGSSARHGGGGGSGAIGAPGFIL